MPDPLVVLILEDNTANFESVTHELRRAGFAAQCERVDTEATFLARLEAKPDIILADYGMAGITALRALEILQTSQSLIPLIVLADAVDEETVVACIQRGAADYLLKDRLLRLRPAVTRALKERELEERYREAQSASRVKSAFLANMSHELRTPLTAVIGFTELLVDGKVGEVPMPQLDLLQDVLGNAKHLLHMINDVLDLARVESGSMRFRPERTWISETIGELISGLRPLAMDKGITLKSQTQLPVTHVFLDPLRLKQVLLNYLSNGLKFTPSGGSITVRVGLQGDSHLGIEVQDTGIGIPPDAIGRLFQDFHQIDDGLGKQIQGTGLGLALTKRLVEAQGGTVGVISTVGQGSTFFATLPFTGDADEDQRGAEGPRCSFSSK